MNPFHAPLGRGASFFRGWIPVLAALVCVACQAQAPLARRPAPRPVVPVASLERPDDSGPVPDYAPMATILTHDGSKELAPELSPLLERLLGAGYRIDRRVALVHDPEPGETDLADDSMLWMRDYQPIFVRESGKLRALLYLSENPNRSEARGLLPHDFPTRTLPLLHENGNLVVAGRFVIVTDHLIQQNAQDIRSEHLLRAGYRPRGRDEVLRLLARNLHRKVDDIIVLPMMPFEPTGHVDVFVLPLDPRTVAVPAIEDRALERRDEGAERKVGRVIQVFLDEQAEFLASLGLDVVRMPMIPPSLQLNDEVEDGDVRNLDRIDTGDVELVVYTPANTLLAHVGERRIAVVPDFANLSDDPKLASLIARYASTWQQMLRDRGWTPHPVDASELVGHLGLVRCVTASLPQ